MAFMFELEREDGTPADPPSLSTAVPMWRPGDTIPWGGRRFAWSPFETTTQTKHGADR
jgi:hypothetical protein